MASDNGTRSATLPSQIRAARSLIGWTQDQLAVASGVPKRTLVRFEATDGHVPQIRTLNALRSTLEAAGVIFVAENGEGPGVRLRKPIS